MIKKIPAFFDLLFPVIKKISHIYVIYTYLYNSKRKWCDFYNQNLIYRIKLE